MPQQNPLMQYRDAQQQPDVDVGQDYFGPFSLIKLAQAIPPAWKDWTDAVHAATPSWLGGHPMDQQMTREQLAGSGMVLGPTAQGAGGIAAGLAERAMRPTPVVAAEVFNPANVDHMARIAKVLEDNPHLRQVPFDFDKEVPFENTVTDPRQLAMENAVRQWGEMGDKPASPLQLNAGGKDALPAAALEGRPAYRHSNGEVFTGDQHADAMDAAIDKHGYGPVDDYVGSHGLKGAFGFTDEYGNFKPMNSAPGSLLGELDLNAGGKSAIPGSLLARTGKYSPRDLDMLDLRRQAYDRNLTRKSSSSQEAEDAYQQLLRQRNAYIKSNPMGPDDSIVRAGSGPGVVVSGDDDRRNRLIRMLQDQQ